MAGIKLIPSYIDKMVNWPQTATGRDMAEFLVFTNYYHESLQILQKWQLVRML